MITCEGLDAVVMCSNGGTISNLFIFYGRDVSNVCPGINSDMINNNNCNNPTEAVPNIDILRANCNGQTSCSIAINNGNLDGDPCPGIFKLARLSWTCTGTRDPELLAFLRAQLNFTCSILDFLNGLVTAIRVVLQALFEHICDWFTAFAKTCCSYSNAASYWRVW